MRDGFNELKGDPNVINPLCPADLVIDHSVQVDFARVYVFYSLSEITNPSFYLRNFLQFATFTLTHMFFN